jgi:putative PIN family toxin of toxin-antitoxin system
MRIVLDTNIIISALLVPASLPGEILDNVLNRNLTIVYDNRILSEYIDVLFRKKFRIDKELARYIIDLIKKEGEFILAMPEKSKFTDESGKKFYEVYKSGNAMFLITGNLKHFPKETGIVTPREFIDNIYLEK